MTSQYGNTPQGQDVQGLIDTLSSSGAVMQQQQPAYEQATTQRLTQESGIPQMQQGQVDLGKIFQLYLADSGLAQKYSSPTQQTPAPTAQDYIKMAQNPSSVTLPDTSKGFTGFTTPSLTTRAMGEVPNSVQDAINMLTGAISGQRTNVKDYTGLASKTYQSSIDALLGLSDRMHQQQKDAADLALKQREEALKEFEAGYTPVSSAQSKNVEGFGDINNPQGYADAFMGGYIDWNDVPSNVKTPVSNIIKKQGSSVQKIVKDQIDRKDGLIGFKDMMDSYYKNSKNLAGVYFLNPIGTGKEYLGQRDIYAKKIQKSLSASRSQTSIDNLLKNLPGDIAISPESGFKGHFQQLLDSTNFALGSDKNGNIYLMDSIQFDPSRYNRVSVTDLSIDQIRNILKNL